MADPGLPPRTLPPDELRRAPGSESSVSQPNGSSRRFGSGLIRSVGRGLLTGLVLILVVHAGYILIGPNLRTVLPGQVYRCAQQSGAALERVIRRKGIRTVINLRGCSDPAPWYLEECRAVCKMGISLEDLGFSAGRLPSVPTIRQLVEVLDRSDQPILIHCQRGADRTGMVAALFLLLYTDTPLERALQQLGPRYGHLPIGRTQNMDRFFVLYQEWLADEDLKHTPERFRRWIEQEYCPGEARATLSVVGSEEGKRQVLRVQRGERALVRVRCCNSSVKAWVLRPGTNAGIHAQFVVHGPQSERGEGPCVGEGRAGLFHATVEPGQCIDLTLALPKLRLPGRYELRVDMVDEQHGAFVQMGSEPLFRELEVP